MSDAIEVPIGGVNSAVIPLAAHNPRARKLRSAVWRDFTKERRPDGNCVAICNHCKKQLTATSRSGTTHLRNHLAICMTTRHRPAGVKPRRKLVVRRLYPNKSSTNGIDHSDENEGGHFDQEVSRLDLARMIVQHGYRFSIVDDVGFQTFVRNLQPQFKMVSYDTARADCMHIFETAKIKLHEMLEKVPCRVSISVEIWHSSVGMEYFCLTCYYIENVGDAWKLRKKILNFVHIETPLAPEQMGRLVLEKLQEWGIDKKLACVVLDNCSGGNVVAREILRSLQQRGLLLVNGDLFHVHSCAHILDRTVQDSLEQASDMINQVRACIQDVKSSQERFLQFQKAAKMVGAVQKPLVSDSPNNWVSTYLMLESACLYQTTFFVLGESDGKHLLSTSDWGDVKALAEVLEALYHTMEKFPATERLTANLYFNEICGIHLLLKTWCGSPSHVVQSVASEMLMKFEKYWDVTRTVMAFASILDPRYKMKSIEYFFKMIYNDHFEAKSMIDSIHKAFINLYNEYAAHSGSSSKSSDALCYPVNSAVSSTSEYGNGEDSKSFSRITLYDARRGLDQYIQETSSGQSLKTDLDMYLEEAVLRTKDGPSENFDILNWWKSFSPKYPVLSMLARDILAIPVSVVPLDSEARTLNEYLSTMDPFTVQGLVCAQDWLREESEVSAVAVVDGGVDSCTMITQGD